MSNNIHCGWSLEDGAEVVLAGTPTQKGEQEDNQVDIGTVGYL